MCKFFSVLRYFINDLTYIFLNKDCRVIIDSDMGRYLKWSGVKRKTGIVALNLCLKQKTFRNVFLYRLKSFKFLGKHIIAKLNSLVLPKLSTVEIGGDIGKGLLISHNFSVIYVKSSGENLRVGPGVVIGRNGQYFPKIGNNVYIASNSTVIGNVVIGDNVIIGAGAVVVKDVPSNSVVVGNPARVIRSINESDLNEIM